MTRYLLHNLRIVTGDSDSPGSIAVEGDRICDVWKKDNDGMAVSGSRALPFDELPRYFQTEMPRSEVTDFHGLTALAGGVDAHVHFREPGMPHKGDIGSESLSAMLGGVTSYIDMPNTNPPTTSAARLSEKLGAAEGRSWANYGFHIGATNTNLSEIESMLEKHEDGIGARDFGGIKIFMGSSTGNMLVDDNDALSAFFRIKDKEILIHSEDESIIKANMAKASSRYGNDIPFQVHKDIRSRQACIRSTAKALELAMRYGTRLHVLHVSTKEEIEMIRAAKQYNPEITAETSANYLWFCSDDYERLGSHLKCNPSVKDAEDRAALREALKTGLIDTAGSDHAPHLADEKARKYMSAPSGLPSIRQTLPVLLTVAAEEDIPLSRIASVFSEKTADMFGIRDRGHIKPGCKADIVIVDPAAEHVVTANEYGYRCGWTPYEGVRLNGMVKAVYINGCMCVSDGKATGVQPQGQRLTFDR